jgi:hypothetical protein
MLYLLLGSSVLDWGTMTLRRLLEMAGRVLLIWRSSGWVRNRLCRRGRNVDLDIGDRVPFYMVRWQAVTGSREKDCRRSQYKSFCSARTKASPFCSVSVEVCEFTAATVPCTTVFGGFCRVTATEMPMRLDAMFGVQRSAVCKDG